MQDKPIYEVSISIAKCDNVQAEIIRGMLDAAGIEQQNIVESYNGRCLALSLFFNDYEKARKLKAVVKRFNIIKSEVHIKTLRSAEWKTKWKTDYKPFMITSNIKIVPLEHKNTASTTNKRVIYIDTDTVFGSGTHPTTKYVARFIANKKGLFESFLDIGTGTGILSLMAHVCGAGSISAFDYNKEAVRTARANFRLNNVKPLYLKSIACEKYKTNHKYDFVAANLLTDDLIRLKRKIISLVQPGKYLAVSGISIQNYNRFRTAFDSESLRTLKITKEEGWSAILYARVKQCQKN